MRLFWPICLVTMLSGNILAATATSISQNGVTWTFSQAREVGQFVNGEYWVQAPVTIQSVSPAWNGKMHGSMLDPAVGPSQGYRTAAAGFSADLRATLPLTVTAGVKSLISTVGKDKVSGGAAEAIKAAAVLTIVNTPPAAGSFRPPYVSGDKPFFNTSQIQYNLLPRLAKPAGVLPLTQMDYLWLDHSDQKVGGASLHPSDNMPPYPRDMGVHVSRMAVKVLLDIPERDTLLVRFLQLGIDLYYISIKNGDAWRAKGGFGSARKWPILFAGILFNNTAMKSPPKYISTGSNIDKFGEDGHTWYGEPTVAYPNGKPLWGQDCGTKPKWFTNHDCRDPSGIGDADDMPNSGGYRICCTSHVWVGAALATMLMNAKTIWGHNAHLDYVDRWISEPSSWSNSSTTYYRDIYGYGGDGSGFMTNMWNTYRPTVSPVRAPAAASGKRGGPGN
jgi:hypothetical protein